MNNAKNTKSLEVLLYEHLKNDIDLKKLIDTRIYPMNLKQDCLFPALRFFIIYEDTKQDLQGDIYTNTLHFQIDIFSRTYLEARELKELLKSAVYNFKFQSFEFNSKDMYENDTKLFRIVCSFFINR